MSARLVIAFLVLGACTDLPAYEPGTCGNFALEQGEDCDEDNPRCVECRRQCEMVASIPEEGAGEPCPTGYGCGIDGFCHAPSGSFSGTGSFSQVRARDLVITNVDYDGVGDVVGLASNAISVHLGDPSGQLLNAYSTLTPQVRGFPAFVHLDNNDSLDLLVPTADGIAGYSSPDGYIGPHAFAFDLSVAMGCPITFDNNVPFKMFSLSDRYLGVLTVNTMNNGLGIAVVDATEKVICPKQLVPLCAGLPVGNPLMMPTDVDVYPSSTPGQVIAARVLGGLCVVHARAKADLAAPFDFSDITPSRNLGGRPVLADISDTGCPSLIVMGLLPGAAPREFAGTNLAGDCKLAASSTDLPIMPGDAVAIGHLELAPRIAGLGKDALVMSSGVFGIDQTRAGATLLYQSDRPLSFVQSGDIDRDGDLDGVAIAATQAIGVEDIDVLARTTAGEFLLRRIDTEQPIAHFVVADYDGDEVADIAFTEKLAVGSERLSVVFGTRDLPLPPTVFGAYTEVAALCPIQVSDSLDRQKVITDLIVLDLVDGADASPQTGRFAFTLLHGSPQRTLQAFIDPRTTIDEDNPSVFGGVAAGNFFGSTSVDVMAFEFRPRAVAQVWPMKGNAYGQLEAVLPVSYATKIADCSRPVNPITGMNGVSVGLCGDSAHYIAWPLPGQERDVVIGIDDGGTLLPGTTPTPNQGTPLPRQVVVIDPKLIGLGPNFPGQLYATDNPLSRMPDAVDAKFRVQSLVRVDLEGHGDPVLAVSFVGGELGEPVSGEVRLCDVDDRGMLESCPSITTTIPELAGFTCVDIAAAQLAPRGHNLPAPTGTDLAVLCHGRTQVGSPTAAFRVWFDPEAGRRKATLLVLGSQSPATRILVGDVTGDLLDDLAVLLPGQGNSLLAVYPQCEASDLACIYPLCTPEDVDCFADAPLVGLGSK